MPPNVFTNRTEGRPSAGHSTVILLDAINNYWDDLAAARTRLISTLVKLRQDERIAVYVATTRPAGIAVVQDFTTDRTRLCKSIQAYSPPAIEPAPGLIPPPPEPPAMADLRRRIAVTDTMDLFRMVSEHLAKLPGRKSLLWITAGLPPQQVRDMPDTLTKAADALNEANVAVDTLDDDGAGSPSRRWGGGAASTLEELSARTGGTAYIKRNDLDNMMREAIEAERITYTLGFYLPEEERDNQFHPLAVKVDVPGVILSYRRSYLAARPPYAVAPKKREPLQNHLLDAQDSTEIDILAQVARAPGPRPVLRVAMRLGASQVSLRRQGSEWAGKVEQMFLLTTPAGQVVAKVSDIKEFRFPDKVRASIDRDGMPFQQDIKLTDNAARLLIVVRDAESGRTGTLSVPLDQVRNK